MKNVRKHLLDQQENPFENKGAQSVEFSEEEGSGLAAEAA